MTTELDVIVSPPAWSGGLTVAAVDRGAAVDQLPGHPNQDPYERLAMAFLVGYPRHSARAYLSDLKAWGAWCAAAGVHPFDARRHHVDAWVRVLTTEALPRTAKPMAASSIARRLSAISAFYDYGIGVKVLAFSPVANVRRPKVSDDSTTVGLSADELVALLETADTHSHRWGPGVAACLQWRTHRRGPGCRRQRLHLTTRPPSPAHHPQRRAHLY